MAGRLSSSGPHTHPCFFPALGCCPSAFACPASCRAHTGTTLLLLPSACFSGREIHRCEALAPEPHSAPSLECFCLPAHSSPQPKPPKRLQRRPVPHLQTVPEAHRAPSILGRTSLNPGGPLSEPGPCSCQEGVQSPEGGRVSYRKCFLCTVVWL